MSTTTITVTSSIKESFPVMESIKIDDVNETIEKLLKQEDTDHDGKITIEDQGPKRFHVKVNDSTFFSLEGMYKVSTLLQELGIAKMKKLNSVTISTNIFDLKPHERISSLIRDVFWDRLTRTIDLKGLAEILKDSKSNDNKNRIYVPFTDKLGQDYYKHIALKYTDLNLEVVVLPEVISPEYVRKLNTETGILSLALFENQTNSQNLEESVTAAPFIVPGGRFNEMYGWDSYFESLGLLADEKVFLAKSMVDNFVYEIEHYGKILNANRTYYLTRSQPPFLTDMILSVYNDLPYVPDSNDWLEKCFLAAIKEYETVWTSEPRFIPSIGLSRYYDVGVGIPPETESGHFDVVLAKFASKYNFKPEEFRKLYEKGEIQDSEVDKYFVHDRSGRESGHDTTYRFDEKCASLAPFELNCLLFKYETDIAYVIDEFFDGNLAGEESHKWHTRANRRKETLNRLCWNEDKGMFFDFDFEKQNMTDYESATTYYALWSGLATFDQACRLVENLSKFEFPGGIVSSTENSRGPLSPSKPPRQWDFPYGWAPHQILIWKGLNEYGFSDASERLAYKWLHMLTTQFVNYNGTIAEKYDVVNKTHKISVEYGNVGTDFKLVSDGGFGWVNASYQVGLTYLTNNLREKLGDLFEPEFLFK